LISINSLFLELTKTLNDMILIDFFHNPKLGKMDFIKIFIFLFLGTIFICCENENYPYYIKSDDHGVLWVANASDNTITCIDRVNDEKIGTYAVGPSPSRTAVDLKGDCWVGSRGDGTVYFVTQQGNVRKFSGFNAARGVALDKTGNIWIANSGNNTIQKISLPDTTISAQVDLPDAAGQYYGALGHL
jgi:DNA-binding beta-propeller fold protein YncE